jgi:hypothetical protein
MAGLGDPPSVLALARAPLARHQPQIGLDLMGPREAPGVVERCHERGRRDRPHGGHGLQPLDALVRAPHRRDPLVRVRQLFVDLPHHREQRSELREQATGQGQREDPADEPLRTPRRHPPAVLPQQGAEDRNVAGRVRTKASRTVSRARTCRWASDSRCAGRYASTRQASASARASRRSVLIFRVRVAYIGAKFGSATITSGRAIPDNAPPTRSRSRPRGGCGPAAGCRGRR